MLPPRLSSLLAELPLHAFLGLELVESPLGIRLPPGPQLRNATGVIHGGILYSVLDLASFLALSIERPDVHGVTVNFQASMLKPAPVDVETVFRGRVLRAGATLAHLDAEAWSGGALVAAARVTKALRPLSARDD